MARTKVCAPADSHPKVKGAFYIYTVKENMTNGAARGTRQPMFLCKRGMQAHKSEIMERRQERSVGVRWRCLGAAGHSRDVSIPRVHCGDPGGAARGLTSAPRRQRAPPFFLPRISTQQSLRERDTSRCSFRVCLFVYVHFVILI
jgi:hypothetical protein